jgi:hypothetical protein
MGTKELLLLVCCAACGQVDKVFHDAAVDAPPDALICPGAQMACGGACADLMTDNNHCGSCTTVCGVTEGCGMGTCIDATASCASIHLVFPTAASGPYTHTADGAQFFCDMSKSPPVQYNALAMGRYNASYPGMTLIDGVQLQDPMSQQAFVFLFNKQGGFPALETWTANNVCTTSSTAGGTRLYFGGLYMFPYANGTTSGAYTMGTIYTEERIGTGGGVLTPPLPMDYFTTVPASDVSNCGDADNPALFFDKL